MDRTTSSIGAYRSTKSIPDFSLYLVLGADDCRYHSLVTTVELAVAGGVSVVQLREKQASFAEFVRNAELVQSVLQPVRVPLIINDNIRVARRVGAAGVHLGQGDTHPSSARAQLGPGALIGLSISSAGELARLSPEVDYVGVGPVFPTASKTDAAEPMGLERLRRVSQELRLPLVAIGGIDADKVTSVVRAALCGVAVVSAITAAANPKLAAQKLRARIEATLGPA